MSDGSKPPHQLRDETLSTLRRVITTLKSPECLLEVRKAPDEVQIQWAKTLLKFDEARDYLEKADLSQIQDKLKDNENALTEGANLLRQVLVGLDKIKYVLDIATAFINIILKVIAPA
jgi:hypothetical protein